MLRYTCLFIDTAIASCQIQLRYSLFIDLDIAFFEPVLSIPQPEEENKFAYKNAYIDKSLLLKSMM